MRGRVITAKLGSITSRLCSDTFATAQLAQLLPPDNFLVVAPAPFRSSLLKGGAFGKVGWLLFERQ
jgi:hypothetical protein